FPNPSTNFLFMTSSKNQIARIELINESGIISGIYPVEDSFEVNIDVKNLQKGTYFVRLYDNKKILIGIQRFMKVN
ncbi:MAG: T9SS C-terminal target domain-containing protein, partial [Crocinitomicaceae bacterium]|nr:T9SS C-terminal target domain-containing protein [Crocinitomicaceae bacterium]